MKVIGTGEPRMLTIRTAPCERDVLRDELDERRGVVLETIARAQEEAQRQRSSTLPGAPGPEREISEKHGELVLLSRLLDDLCRPVGAGQDREVVGPTWLLKEVIRGAAGEAVYRLRRSVEEFRQDRGRPTADELRASLAAAAACVETLIGLDYADNHGIDD